VADLVALGLSNREVADRLFLSVNTVQTTLRHVFGKLDVSSRAELAARIHDNQ
jgi:DNA-binding CsgD family transcriptional regulator